MDFRPLGDGMSCVAVAMPWAARREGTTDAAPELRRIYTAGGKDDNRTRCPFPSRLPITPDDNVGEAERRVTNQKGMRGAARRGGVGGRATRALASIVKKDGTRLIRAGQLPGRGSRYGV
jgi:hypothetical protein